MKLTRRGFLSASAIAVGTVVPNRFRFAMADDGFLELTAAETKQGLYGQGPQSDLWAYNGACPGPEIRAKKGERIRVRLINKLDEGTSIHWHGVRIANTMDGVSGLTQDAVPPDGTFEYDFKVPDAGTYWYHAHNRSWNQVGRGLYGSLIIDEPEQPFDRDHDLTLVIDDWRLDPDGVLDQRSFGSFMDWSHGGRLGNWLTVNGQSQPHLSLNAGEAYRLRLINASNARVLEIDPNAFAAKILAFDGQALPDPAKLNYTPLLLGPAQRVDLLVVPEVGQNFALAELSGRQPFEFAFFDTNGKRKDVGDVPRLSSNDLPEPDIANGTKVRLEITGGAMGQTDDITFQGKKLEGEEYFETGQVWALNGLANEIDKPLFKARRGETVVLESYNNSAFPHAMHLHGHHFRVIERSGSSVEENAPWRDTFMIGPMQTTKIAFVADNPGKWLLHCHMLEHAAAGMNAWFDVA